MYAERKKVQNKYYIKHFSDMRKEVMSFSAFYIKLSLKYVTQV
jgi:hypothetical protein